MLNGDRLVNGCSLVLGVANRGKLTGCSTLAIHSATAKLYLKLSARPLYVVNHACTSKATSFISRSSIYPTLYLCGVLGAMEDGVQGLGTRGRQRAILAYEIS